ncbi:MAG: CBS domain-containing protein, partial [Planctomycetes bacterium]|nr:CBS domain-containing protein [Planctomycetota bacterium]
VEGIGNDKLPETTWLDAIDEFRPVHDKDSFNVARRLAREEGLFVGGSSGTATKVAIDVAHELDDPDRVVLVFLTDTGERYLSKFHNDEWMRENRFLDEPARDVRQLLLHKTAAGGKLISIPSSATFKQALDLMSRHNVSQLPVIDHGESVGSIRESRLMAQVIEKHANLESTVGQFLDPPFPVVGANENIEYVSRMLGRDNPALLVRTGGEITGILTRFDVIQSVNG